MTELKTQGEDDDDIFREIVQLALNVTEGQRCLLVLFDEVQNTFYNKIYHTKNVRTLHEEAEAKGNDSASDPPSSDK